MGLPGKPNGMSGADVEQFYRDGRIREIADYCETDVVNTYRVWLRYELFRGRLTEAEFQASEDSLVEFIRARSNAKPHLAGLLPAHTLSTEPSPPPIAITADSSSHLQ